MPIPDAERLNIANELIDYLDREATDERVMALIRRADRCCNEGNREAAFQCCYESYQLAREIGNPSAQAVACFHLGLHTFVFCQNEEFDRAADLCEQAAQLFHTALKANAEGIAWLAVGRVAKYACEHGKDRRHRAMSALLKAVLILETEQSALSETACNLYKALVDHYGSQSHSSRSSSSDQSTAEPPPTENARTSSVPPRHFVYDSEPEPSHPRPVPVTLKYTLIIGSIIFGLISVFFGWQAVSSENLWLLGVGFVIGFVGSVVWTFAILWAAGHLICHVPPDTHAVRQYRNGDLSVLESGARWLWPTVERICAFVPTTRISFELFPLELTTKALVPLLVRLKINCQVINAVRLMKTIDATPQSYLLGLPKPLSTHQVQTRIKSQFELTAKNLVYQIVEQQSAADILQASGRLKRDIRLALRSQVSRWGVKIHDDFEVEFYVR
jgi:hypothetical protein